MRDMFSLIWTSGTNQCQPELLVVDGDPNGIVSAESASLAVNPLSGAIYIKTTAGDKTWASGGIGPAGPAGPQGEPGDAGAAGAAGATGAAGANGSNGATGAQGTQGIQGVKGDTGSAGTNGTNGAAGATGATGSTGATGAAGQNASFTQTTLDLPYPAKMSHEISVADAGISAASKVMASLAGSDDNSTNGANMTDLLQLTAQPRSGSILFKLNFLTPTAGPFLVNYSAAA